MKRINPSELQVTDYQELPSPIQDRSGIITAFVVLVWLMLLVLSVGAVAGATYYHLQRMGGETHAR